MGLIRFRVSDRRLLPADAVDRAYFTGLDEIPWRSRTQWTDEGISLRRVEEDSGNFHIPWIVSGVGEVSLQTGCLMERDEPYLLAVELARGTVNRIRNQLAVWQTAGVSIADRPALLVEALELLSKAATSQNEPAKAEQLAQQVLTTAQDLISQLCRAYSENAAAARRRQQTRPATVFGVAGRQLLRAAARGASAIACLSDRRGRRRGGRPEGQARAGAAGAAGRCGRRDRPPGARRLPLAGHRRQPRSRPAEAPGA